MTTNQNYNFPGCFEAATSNYAGYHRAATHCIEDGDELSFTYQRMTLVCEEVEDQIDFAIYLDGKKWQTGSVDVWFLPEASEAGVAEWAMQELKTEWALYKEDHYPLLIITKRITMFRYSK
jgi:hypothetical protein